MSKPESPRISVKIKNKTYHLDPFFVNLISIKEFGKPYDECKTEAIAFIRSLVKDIDELTLPKIHQTIVLYCVPKKLQNSFGNYIEKVAYI